MKSSIFLMILISSFYLSAQELAAPQTYLTKLSKSLRGLPPELAERDELEKTPESLRSDFFQKKIQEYLASEKFTLILKTKVDELFMLNSQLSILDLAKMGAYPVPSGGVSSYDLLVNSMIGQNKSWDLLLVGKDYQAIPHYGGVDINEEINSFQMIVGGQLNQKSLQDYFKNPISSATVPDGAVTNPDGSVKIYSFHFEEKDPRVAGVLTTPRFLHRFVNTALNKNRRRAAAIFRTMLCDSMIPSLSPKSNETEKNDFKVIFPTPPSTHSDSVTEDQLRNAVSSATQHGNQPDCRVCHSKLDPMGSVFAFTAASLAPLPAPGALVFHSDIRNQNINIPVVGVGDLAKNITNQPEYVRCQVDHFWNWFIGKDVPRSRARTEELMAVFNQMQRRPKDFVSYLVASKEFKQKPQLLSEAQIVARQAVGIMKNCNSCHFNVVETYTDINHTDLTELPYSADAGGADLVKKIRKNLDIAHNGANRKMPPKDSLWQLNSDQFEVLKQWINQGAPDFTGRPQIPVEQP